jgi:hypothetical protein
MTFVAPDKACPTECPEIWLVLSFKAQYLKKNDQNHPFFIAPLDSQGSITYN